MIKSSALAGEWGQTSRSPSGPIWAQLETLLGSTDPQLGAKNLVFTAQRGIEALQNPKDPNTNSIFEAIEKIPENFRMFIMVSMAHMGWETGFQLPFPLEVIPETWNHDAPKLRAKRNKELLNKRMQDAEKEMDEHLLEMLRKAFDQLGISLRELFAQMDKEIEDQFANFTKLSEHALADGEIDAQEKSDLKHASQKLNGLLRMRNWLGGVDEDLEAKSDLPPQRRNKMLGITEKILNNVAKIGADTLKNLFDPTP